MAMDAEVADVLRAAGELLRKRLLVAAVATLEGTRQSLVDEALTDCLSTLAVPESGAKTIDSHPHNSGTSLETFSRRAGCRLVHGTSLEDTPGIMSSCGESPNGKSANIHSAGA